MARQRVHRQLERANAGCGRTHHASMRICMCICMWYAATARVRSSVERRSSAREREEAEATRELGEAGRQPTWRSRRRQMTCVRAPGSFSLPGVPLVVFFFAGHAPRELGSALHAAYARHPLRHSSARARATWPLGGDGITAFAQVCSTARARASIQVHLVFLS